MNVYLAGGMKSTWQDDLIALCPDITFFDPRRHGLLAPVDYTKWDLAHVEKADAVVAQQMASDNPSGFGLSLEIGFACALGKRIVFIDQIAADWRSRYFDMHRVVAHAVVRSTEEAARYLRA